MPLDLCSCGKDNLVRLYDVPAQSSAAQPRCTAVCVGHTESVSAVVCSRAGRGSKAFAVSGSRDLTLKVWHVPQHDDASSNNDSLSLLPSVKFFVVFFKKNKEIYFIFFPP